MSSSLLELEPALLLRAVPLVGGTPESLRHSADCAAKRPIQSGTDGGGSSDFVSWLTLKKFKGLLGVGLQPLGAGKTFSTFAYTWPSTPVSCITCNWHADPSTLAISNAASSVSVNLF